MLLDTDWSSVTPSQPNAVSTTILGLDCVLAGATKLKVELIDTGFGSLNYTLQLISTLDSLYSSNFLLSGEK